MLQGIKISKRFGGLMALSHVDFEVRRGEIVGLIGPNGSGKTTLFNVISGLYRPESGEIFFEGKRISGLPPYKIAHLGIGRTFQIVRPLMDLSLTQNVAISVLYG
ncbi:MAG: ATP-binding cassette domain-containing protein, partial [Proteobacteria bacterium]|nr:ATP-binding cassette domain-containing protein [Pseudomonadota bacterium]